MKDAQIHVRDLGFPEGPVVLPDGGIAFVDLLHQKIRRYHHGKTEVLATVQGSPNGMRLGPDGALYIANNGGLAPRSMTELQFAEPMISGRIQRLVPGKPVEDFATGLPGEGPWRPNDLVFSPRGDIVFTNPQNWEVLRDPAQQASYRGGEILLATSDGAVRRLAKMTGFPNGLAFHPDGSLLVGVTMEHRIVHFPWHGDHVGAPTTWCTFDDGFNPDGMAFDRGRLYVTGSVGDRVAIVDSSARIEGYTDTGPGSDPTNLCIQGNTLWVTFGLAGQLVAYRI